jgi:hypothetical protein
MYHFGRAICFTGALALLLGCSSSQSGGAKVAAVKGTVTMDGKAVPTGEIHFGTPGAPPRVLAIKDGAFSGEAAVGKNQVEVFIYVEGPPANPAKYGGERSKTNVAPQKYWGPKTTLEATVNADGANDFKFPLTSR